MFKIIREWFANIGKLPPAMLAELQAEGIILIDEKTRGSITYRNFHAPGKYSGYRKVGFISSVAVTKTRLYATSSGRPAINVPFTDERIRSINFSLENDSTLRAVFDASLFQPTWSGEIEYRFHTPEAQHFLDEIKKRIP